MDKIIPGDEDTFYPLRDKVFTALREAILNGSLKPGQNLIETKLAEEMGVSRTPIREAIRKLELEGLVSSVPNKGVVVKGISVQDVNDIYTIRFCLEGLAARWAVARVTEEELAKLEENLDLMEFYTKRNDLTQVNSKNTEFHETIFRATKSKPLRQILSSLQEHVQRARTASLQVPGRPEKALSEHRAIFEAFKKRDAEAAEHLITLHIKNSRDNLLKNKKEGEEVNI
jgi:DNA-binding GntR family transcriptional regulator